MAHKGRVDAVLLDLDGTLYHGGRAIPGAVESLAALRSAGVPFRCVTNTTRRPRAAIIESMASMGLEIEQEECLTSPVVAASWLVERGAARVSLLLAEPTFVDFKGLERDDLSPDYVVVGDLGRDFTYDLLDRAFRALMAGAELVALQKNRYWDPGDGLHLDAGPFIAALEYASGKAATVIGKPSRDFFEAALTGLGIPLSRVVMVGDSLEGDVGGIQRAGGLGVLVRTGKFRREALDASDVAPDDIIDSVADLPRWLGI